MRRVNNARGPHTHSGQLERWYGAEVLDRIVQAQKKFYWPIPMFGVPGRVYAMPGGDFCGKIEGGQFGSAWDRATDRLAKMRREERARVSEHRVMNSHYLRTRMDHRAHAFASLSAVYAARSNPGKYLRYKWQKTGVASNAIGNANDLWTRTGFPGAGAAGAGAPGGTAFSASSTGAIPGYRNGATADSNHVYGGWVTASVINNSLLMYDRLFAVAKTMNSTTTEAVTGVPTRYQSATDSDVEYAGGNFITISNPTTVLAATAHSVTAASTAVWTYTNQAGTTSKNLNHNGTAIQTLAGVSACVVGGVDLAVGNWFIPLAAGDYGIKALTQMQLSAAVATGTLDAVIGHPLGYFACPIANIAWPKPPLEADDSLNSVLDDACIAFLELPKPATTATNYSGEFGILSE